MTLRRARLALVLLLAAAPSLAALDKYKDWSKSPEFAFLATDAEQKDWKKIASDEEADRFIQLFWAKRDPDLKTPVNEFKVVFDQRVKEADQLFAMPRIRGALTERGKLYDPPRPPEGPQARGRHQAAARPVDPSTARRTRSGIPPPNDPGTSIGESIVTFTYEAAELPDWARVKSLTAAVRGRVVERLRRRPGTPPT